MSEVMCFTEEDYDDEKVLMERAFNNLKSRSLGEEIFR